VFDALGWVRRLGALAVPLLRYGVESFQPDRLILTADSAALGEAALAALARRHRASFWHFDPQRPPTAKAIMVARLAEATFTTYLPLVDPFRQQGARAAFFLPQGVDPEVDRPALRTRQRYACDVAFIGSGGYPYREELLRAVARAARLQIRGPGWEASPPGLPIAGGKIVGPDFARAVAGASIILGANAIPEQAESRASASNRMWKVFGCGGFYLGPWVDGIEHFARGGEHCAWFRTSGEAVELIRRYLSEPDARQRIAAAGRQHALAHHTYAHRLERLLAGTGYSGV
jgi:hypothetical protein